jgi:VanZ family protein
MTRRSPTVEPDSLKKWLPVGLWLALIFYFSTDQFSSSNTSQVLEPVLDWLLPGMALDRIALVHSLLRKLGHWGEYFVFSILLLRALRDSHENWKLRHATLSIMFVFFYAAGDEFHQSFVPSRTANVNDVLIDLLGGICGIIWIIQSYERKRKDKKEQK